jgi:hypothetical protein
MKRTIPVPAWIVASLLVCSTAGAQVRGVVAAPAAPMARPAVVHVAPAAQPGAGMRAAGIAPRAAVRRVSGTHMTPVMPNFRFVTPTNATHANGLLANSSDAPGLGFDYSDFFALHPNQNTIGRDRSGLVNGFAFFSPFGLYGYPYFSTDTSAPDQSPAPAMDQEAQPQQQQQPQIVIVMPPGYSTGSSSATGAQTPSQSSTGQAPVTDTAIVSSEYVLLKRDGGVLFANAFTVQSGQMVYITPEGNRRKITLAELDVDATRKMNEERGTTITLPSDSSTR